MPAASRTGPAVLTPELQRFDLNSDGVIDRHELLAAKRELELIMWAAKTAEEKGLPQAAAIKAKGAAFQSTYEALEEMAKQTKKGS